MRSLRVRCPGNCSKLRLLYQIGRRSARGKTRPPRDVSQTPSNSTTEPIEAERAPGRYIIDKWRSVKKPTYCLQKRCPAQEQQEHKAASLAAHWCLQSPSVTREAGREEHVHSREPIRKSPFQVYSRETQPPRDAWARVQHTGLGRWQAPALLLVLRMQDIMDVVGGRSDFRGASAARGALNSRRGRRFLLLSRSWVLLYV